MRRSATLVFSALAFSLASLLAPAAAIAQRQRTHPARTPSTPEVILRGVVLRQDSVTPAPYASVEVVDGGNKRFSNENGEFSFKLAPGRYRLRARQIGFAPHDTVVELSASAPVTQITLRLASLAVRLADVTVRKPQKCTTPGVDSTDEPYLYGVIAAVRENALRELTLRQSYPYEYIVRDIKRASPVGGTPGARFAVDTLGYRSDRMAPYRVGETVFTDRSDPLGAEERMRLPSPVDFADPAFMQSHCFDYGYDDAGDYQLRFEPLASMGVPDVAGSVTLDTTTFVIRSVTVRLTRAGEVATGFRHLEVHATYREVAPRVAVPLVITATQSYRTPDPDGQDYVATEMQQVHTFRYLSRVPDGAPREQSFIESIATAGARSRVPPGGMAR